MTYRPARQNGAAALPALALKWHRLTIFRTVVDDDVGEWLGAVLDVLAEEDEPDGLWPFDSLARASEELLALANESRRAQVGDLWQDHVLERLLSESNPISEIAERAGDQSLSPGLERKARAELKALQSLHAFSLDAWHKALLDAFDDPGALDDSGAAWKDVSSTKGDRSDAGMALKRRFAEASDWSTLLGDLFNYYRSNGTGVFGSYRAFRWISVMNGGELEGIPHPDPVRLTDLVEYEDEKAMVVRNTSLFVQGSPGNSVLLFGDAGTGKSSLVKALLNEFGDQGLRIIEVPKEQLGDFPYIVRELAGRRERFIVFVDDLSFEETETEYKALKAALEGTLEARPDNVLVYATSNRRHLIRENFADRAMPGDEVHPGDTNQEKLSLSDRFGLRIGFRRTDQEQYLSIVRALTQQAGITVPDDVLRLKAIQWSQYQNGFSGRTARQFVNDLIGAAAAGEVANWRIDP